MKWTLILTVISLLGLAACRSVPSGAAPTVEPTRSGVPLVTAMPTSQPPSAATQPSAPTVIPIPTQPPALPTPIAATTPTVGPMSQSNTATGRLGQNITLKTGEVALIQGEGVMLELVGVTEDSRCPQGVTCVWAGRVVATVRLGQSGAQGEDISLSTQTKEAATKAVNGYTVTLIDVKPVKTTQAIASSEYRLTFVVNKS
jgi:hypothetical protein